jgi:hypothetical protein
MRYHGNATLTLRQRHELVLEIEAGSTSRRRPPTTNPATGEREYPCLISLNVDRADFPAIRTFTK